MGEVIERRYCELRQDGRRLFGVAVQYGDVARLAWGSERIEAGAFAPVGDVILNAQHDRGRPLARTGAGLVVADDNRSLRIEAELPETRDADDVLALVRARVLLGLSIEFRAVSERLDGRVRVIERAKLSGIGIVDTPAYSSAEVEARMQHAAQVQGVNRRPELWSFL